MKEKLEMDKKILTERKQKIQGEMIITKQLLANIQKNRINVTQQYAENDNLALSRKLAIQSLKNKLDE